MPKLNKKIVEHSTFWKPHMKRRGIDPKKFLVAMKAVKKITGLDFTDFYAKVACYIYSEENVLEKETYMKKRILKLMKTEKEKQIVELGSDFYEVSSGNRKDTRLIFKLVEKNDGLVILITTYIRSGSHIPKNIVQMAGGKLALVNTIEKVL